MALGAAQQRQSDEASLIAGILAGDTQLYHDLIRPYERTVFITALSVLKNEADAEEVTQEAFLKAFRSISTFRAESKFGTWLISIVLNEARARLRPRPSFPCSRSMTLPERVLGFHRHDCETGAKSPRKQWNSSRLEKCCRKPSSTCPTSTGKFFCFVMLKS